MVRPARPGDLPLIDPRLGDALFGQPPSAWCWLAVTRTDDGREQVLGHLLGALLFATWQAVDIFDIWQVRLADPDDHRTAGALLDRARAHAAEHGLAGVRWLQSPEPRHGPLTHPAAERRDKLRFTLTTGQGAAPWADPSAMSTPASPGSSHPAG